ncbi:glycoside hydrolase family 3 C-terminal domain-containing protein [Flavobacteriaceae bacterium]|nr:glycoside hydrolase family 3 C-terminal domain-containing protein [Flavobacteriaceae bacterium]MDB2329016.1 glycoside hydrolase family 3 C-terminal domain-containing protein [Flavobacteriaceae bacterium]MDB2345316.1 glycoside hydrolase family 3 C-terminal domain-containing protein [Flavobacteriaceae bacterium]MDB4674634.1 glycoside hydrolase family 3 C-terminal domain-containing protein [Flavobacteriaceae bacterium]
MNKSIAILLGILLFVSCNESIKDESKNSMFKLINQKSEVLLEKDGVSFRDLNGNEKLDIYEDVNQPIEDRIDDLLSQMTLEEKAGMMFINGAPVSVDGKPDGTEGLEGPASRMASVVENMNNLKMNHFNIWSIPADPNIFAQWYNNTQQVAEKTRLGIPITIASDPRHHFSNSIFSLSANGFTQFCEMPGFAAIGDEKLVSEFANIVREEYLAVGIREALHPQIDLATEPRWSRVSGNFSEDAELTARLVKPYILGLQGENLSNGVACMTKHFPGGGPQKEGLDPHFSFQKGQIYPGDNFDYHLIPFEAAFEVNTAAIMPYYGIPTDQTDENVAMAYNKRIITNLLREKYKYDGVVCTDWGLITDRPMGPGVVWKARAWGVEDLSASDRALKIIEAGCDQFGGENRPELIIQLVNEDKLTIERIDVSVKRLLKQKFELGLFDNPFVDEKKVEEIVGSEASIKLGKKTQQISMTLLKNENSTLPLEQKKLKVYIENINRETVANYAEVVATPEEADFAIIRLNTPWYPAKTDVPFAKGFHHGDLNFKGDEKQRIIDLLNKVPTVVDIYLDRPAVIPEIADAAKALIANYGASDESVCEVLFGNTLPQGKLPFELPSSMEAVENQKTDVPYDSENPLFKFGFGLTY